MKQHPRAATGGDWLPNYNGTQRIEVLNPRPAQFSLIDIAYGLSRQRRFGSFSPVHYSVAAHSVYVSKHVSRAEQARALLHDAAEAYIGDITTPLKVCLPEYRRIEALWDAAIAARFGLGSLISAEVKIADSRAMLAERRDLMGPQFHAWDADIEALEPFDMPVRLPGSETQDRHAFLERAFELGLS